MKTCSLQVIILDKDMVRAPARQLFVIFVVVFCILLYEQFIHYTLINLRQNMRFLSAQQRAYQSFSSYFLV